MTGKGFKSKIAFMLFFTYMVIFLSGGKVYAKDPEFLLEIESRNLQKGVSTTLVLSMVNAQNAQVESVTGLENFDVMSTSEGQSTSIVNGDKTVKYSVDYAIMAKSTGDFTLQGNVKYNGKSYKTNVLKVNVSDVPKVDKGNNEDVFMKTIISNEEMYFGQKATLIYELYSRYNISTCNTTENINVDGLMISEIKQDRVEQNLIDIGGETYAKYQIKKMFVSSIKAGEYNIPAFKFQANIITGGGFFSNTKAVYLQTEPKKLTVKPLPQKGKPNDFSGIVGKLNLEANYSRQEMNVGDSLTLKVKASGNCNIESLDKIIKNGVPGFTVYETDKELKESVENDKYYAEKEFEVILVPEKNGDIKIDPISISYFDPETGNYAKADIPGTTIKVKGEIQEAVVKGQGQGGKTQLETVKIDQVSYNAQGNDGYYTIKFNKKHTYIVLGILVILLLIAAAFLYWFKFAKKYDKNLKEMYKQLNKINGKSDIYGILNSMVKYHYGISLKASSRNNIIAMIKEKEILDPVLEIMEYMENDKNNSEQGDKSLKDKVKGIYKRLAGTVR